MQTQQALNGLSADADESFIKKYDELRNQVINFILFMYATVGLAAIAIRLYFFCIVNNRGWDFHMSFFTAAYLVLLGTAICHRKLSCQFKIYIILTFLFTFGLYSLFISQIFGGGRVWLTMFCLFVTVLFDARKGIYSVIAVFTITSIIGALIFFNIIDYNPDSIVVVRSASGWITTTIIIMLNLFCLIYSQGKFNKLLNDSIETLTNQTKTLKLEVSRRENSEKVLRETESKYRVLFENAGDSILLMKDNTIIDCNQKTCEMFGEKKEQIIKQEPFGLSSLSTPVGSNIKGDSSNLPDLTSREDTLFSKWQYTKNDGTIVYIEPVLTEIELSSEIYTLAILRNVTDRMLAEKKLIQEKNFSETVINSLPGIFFMCDESRNLIRWNKNHELITGYSAGELRRMKVHDWVDEGAKDYVDHKFQEGFVEGSLRLELNVNIKNGEKIPFYLRGRSLSIDNRTYLLGIGYDLTDRKAAEKSLAVSEKRFRELVETLAVGICILKDNVVVYMNPKQVEILGKYPDSYDIKDFPFHPEDIETVLKSYETVVSGENPTFELETRLFQYRKITGKNRTKLVYCNGNRINYLDEMAVLMTMVDITKTRELEQLVQIREKMVSLGHVAAGIAHEIRNPLSGINILVDGIREDFEDPANAEIVKKDVFEIQKASNKISAVIKRVLDFSRPGRPSLKLKDINNAVMEAVELSRVTLKKEKVSIKTSLAVNLPKIEVDAQAMEQVLLNLINNAANAMKSFDGSKQIEVSSWLEEDEVFLSVADSGNGVPDDLKEKIFDPFFTTRSEGSGIGLSLCQRIITDHGGIINVIDSDLGGAGLIIKLPVTKR